MAAKDKPPVIGAPPTLEWVALDQLLEHVWLPTATAYSTLQRAVRLGVIEHCGRNLYPTRH